MTMSPCIPVAILLLGLFTTNTSSVYQGCSKPKHFCIGIKSDESSIPKEAGCINDKDCQLLLKVSREEQFFEWTIAFNSITAGKMEALVEITNETVVLNKSLNAAEAFSPIKLFMALNSYSSEEPICQESIDGNRTDNFTKQFIYLKEKTFNEEYSYCVFILEPFIETLFDIDNDNLTVIISVANDTTGIKGYFVQTFTSNSGVMTVNVFDLHNKHKRPFDLVWLVIIVLIVWSYVVALLIICNPCYIKRCSNWVFRDHSPPGGTTETFDDIAEHHERRLDFPIT